ncbi:MAG: MFS transporter, partial [Candidatus Pacebacteria bacterium]|nr:MFS transporter [Candidatus Paceibacterota bacterium]
SAWYLGMIGLAGFLPFVVMSIFSGMLIDRFDRRKVLTIAYCIYTVAALLLFVNAWHDPTRVWPVFIIMGIVGMVRAFTLPTQQALTPNAVPRSDLAAAISLGSSTNFLAIMIGPALGGLLYGFGADVVYATTAGMLLLSIAVLLKLRITAPPLKREPFSFDHLFLGLRFIRHRRPVMGAISLDLFAVLLGGATALLPIYAQTILQVGPVGLGLLRTAPALGSMIMAVSLAWRPLTAGAGKIMLWMVAFFGLATIVFGLSTNIYLSLAALLVLGGTDMVSVYVRQTMIQAGTPDEMRGRVGAVSSLFIGASNELGEFESGVTAAIFGTVPAVVIGGVGTILVAIFWAIGYPELRKVDLSPEGLDRLAEAGQASMAHLRTKS